MIDRDAARRIAAGEILARDLGTGVRAVRALEELKSKAPVLYGWPDLAACWIAYGARPASGIFNSNIVVVSRSTGEIFYSGNASDEG